METHVFHHQNWSLYRYVGRVVATRVGTYKCLKCCKFKAEMHLTKHGAGLCHQASPSVEKRHGHGVGAANRRKASKSATVIGATTALHNNMVQQVKCITVQARCMGVVWVCDLKIANMSISIPNSAIGDTKNQWQVFQHC